ncbi:MAG TPA: segregation/condensation protein A [Tepidisphaeraceae bacterium]|nr:segregation/condensation protein A [Tepidisphaeraceae bacterium]
MDYRVELDIYNGPLDLLLYLIKRDELDIYDIPIARITDSYMGYINMLGGLGEKSLDINVAGDFLVMAATLMEIKSATLLPKPPPLPGQDSSAAAELADPRYELIQKLLEYKRFKDSAFALERQQQTFAARFPRVPAKMEGAADEPPPVDLDEVQIWDLLDAFNKLMKEVGGRKPKYHEVIYDDTPIDLHAADIEDRLRREKKISFKQLLIGRKSRSEMIGLFLALLELIREKKIIVRQSQLQDVIADAENDFEILPAENGAHTIAPLPQPAPAASPVAIEAHLQTQDE